MKKQRETCGREYGKPVANPWQTRGKPVANTWQKRGKHPFDQSFYGKAHTVNPNRRCRAARAN
jgi:hypothetical protein